MDDASACALALTFIILLRLCHQGPPPCHSSRDEALLQVLFTADPGLLDAHQEIFALDASADPVVRFTQATGLISHRSPVDWARLPLLVPVLRAAWASHAASSPAPLPLACACACFVLSQRLRRPGPVISEPCVLGKAARGPLLVPAEALPSRVWFTSESSSLSTSHTMPAISAPLRERSAWTGHGSHSNAGFLAGLQLRAKPMGTPR